MEELDYAYGSYKCKTDPRIDDVTLEIYTGVVSRYMSIKIQKTSIGVLNKDFGEDAELTIITHLESCETCSFRFNNQLKMREIILEVLGAKKLEENLIN
mgnify:CR=1 FL=1